MNEQSVVAVNPTMVAAEQAVRALTQARFPGKEISLVARDFSQEGPEETGLGQARHLAKVGVGVALRAAIVSFPGVLAASLVGGALAGASGAVVGSVLGDVVKALGVKGTLPRHLAGYEEAVKGGKFLMIAHGSSAEVEQAREILFRTSPSELTVLSEEVG
jgi:hypothetical protein